jgi:hypothetical protein
VPPARVRLTTAKFSLRRNRKLRLARPWASASGGGLRLARPQGSASTSASEGGLRLARPQGSASTSASEGGLRLADPRARPQPRPRRNRVLARPRPRPQEKSPPRPTLGSDRPRHGGYIVTLPLASSGYRGTRLASHLARPGNK